MAKYLTDTEIRVMNSREAQLTAGILQLDVKQDDDLETLRGLLLSLKYSLIDCNVQNNLREVLKNDGNVQATLRELYEDVLKVLNDYKNEGVEVYDMNYGETVETSYTNLITKNMCPILFVGETSSGKTTLVNELLGEDVLPTSVVHSTSVICQLENAPRKSCIATRKDGARSEYNFDGKNDDHIRTALKELIEDKSNVFNQVDVSWPLPIIDGRVTLVDSPGFGTNTEMNDILYEYLSRAAAFIYVVNISNAGGIQDDRLVKVLDYIQSQSRDTETSQPITAMFVLYKWDQVPHKERDKVEDIVFEKLSWHWPGLKRDQLYKLSLHTKKKKVPTATLR